MEVRKILYGEEPKAVTSIKVRPTLWREFKAQCAKEGLKMADVLEQLILGWLMWRKGEEAKREITKK